MHLKLMDVSPNFQEASTKAREVARHFEQTTAVRPHLGGGWAVLVESVPDRALLIAKRLDEAEMESRLEGDLYDHRSVDEPSEGYTSAEFSSDQDDWYRSYSDGWFYDD
jgi:hypothetical protein